MLHEKTDEELIASLEEREVVFKELIRRYTSSIFNFTAHLAGKTNATDLTQEVFIKVWKNLKKFDYQRASFKTWIFTIAKNTTLDFIKKKKTIVFSDITTEDGADFSENITDETILPDQALQKLQDSDLLNKFLEEIPTYQKTILVLHYQEEMTFDEIGKILNKPLNTVKSQHQRAIKNLREKLL